MVIRADIDCPICDRRRGFHRGTGVEGPRLVAIRIDRVQFVIVRTYVDGTVGTNRRRGLDLIAGRETPFQTSRVVPSPVRTQTRMPQILVKHGPGAAGPGDTVAPLPPPQACNHNSNIAADAPHTLRAFIYSAPRRVANVTLEKREFLRREGMRRAFQCCEAKPALPHRATRSGASASR